jgi:MFS family permease
MTTDAATTATATTTTGAPAPAGKPPAFAALRVRGYRAHFITYVLAMMADNIEHVISYWVAFQKFHSPALGGFAVLSHWLPFLAFSVAVGALNDRFDSRRIIQIGMGLFMLAAAGWGYFFATDSLTIGAAMVLLVVHGCAGVLWQTSSQMLLHDIVGPGPTLASAVRLNATARYLGILVGPAVGGVIMLTLGPTRGIFLNVVFYLPLLLWLWRAPYGRHFRGDRPAQKRAVRGLADITETLRELRGLPIIAPMVVLAGAASFFIGNSYQAQMPGFAHDFGHGDPGTAYSALLAADAAGALTAGLLLESGGGWLPTTVAAALRLALLWAVALFAFARVHTYALALPVLFAAGFFELSFSSIAMALAQIHAPPASRGRILGLFNMAALGLRAFSGITVGLVGSLIGIHQSLAGSAMVFILVIAALMRQRRARPGGVPAP